MAGMSISPTMGLARFRSLTPCHTRCAYARFVGREVFDEKIGKLLCRCIKGRLVGPNIARNQNFGGRVWAFGYQVEAEDRIALGFGLDKGATADGSMIARVSASLIRLPMPYEPCPWAKGRLGISHQRAILGDAGVLLVTDGMFVERAGG
jgi:hypothetical protein